MCFLQEREVKWTDVDGAAILGKYKGKPTKATIEHFRDGASCRYLRNHVVVDG